MHKSRHTILLKQIGGMLMKRQESYTSLRLIKTSTTLTIKQSGFSRAIYFFLS